MIEKEFIFARPEPNLTRFGPAHTHKEGVLDAVSGYLHKKTARKGRRTAVRTQKRAIAADYESAATRKAAKAAPKTGTEIVRRKRQNPQVGGLEFIIMLSQIFLIFDGFFIL